MPTNAQRTNDNHGLEITFSATKKFLFEPLSLRIPWTEVAIIDEANPTFLTGGAPVAVNYSGAHCIYRGYMEQFECKGGKRLMGIREVALKWVVGAESVVGTSREAALYDKELRPLHGTVVPRFYGFFLGIIGDVEVGCLVLEWCKREFADEFEFNRQRMLAGLQLHKAGVSHGKLLDASHYIPLSGGTLRIVGFSSAKTHRCVGTAVLTRDTTGDPRPNKNCVELAALESRFGVDAERSGNEVRWANRMFPELDCSFYIRY